jgi:HPr kinase/phosphorylase
MGEQNTLPFITVGDLYEHNHKRISLQILNGEVSFSRKIREKELHRPGLALSGFVEVFTYWRVQIMGNTEIGYLNTLRGERRLKTISTVLGFDLPCIIITNNNPPPKELVTIANQNGITLFSTPLSTTAVSYHLGEYLDEIFASHTIVHGSLVDVYGVGMLITGPSSIGKSELALDLVERGHQLIADDVVHITRVSTNVLEGAPSDVLTHHMEIRGLGIIDVRRMFGIRAIRGKKVIEIVVKLEQWNSERDYERTGVDEKYMEIMGIDVPLVELPIFPGKNITVIAEVIAMNHKLKERGEYTAKDFNDRLIEKMLSKSKEE